MSDTLRGEGDREEDGEEDRGGKAGFLLGDAGEQRRGRHQPDAAEGAAGDQSHRLLAVARRQLLPHAAVRQRLHPPLRQPGRRRRRESEQRKAAEQEDGQRGDERE